MITEIQFQQIFPKVSMPVAEHYVPLLKVCLVQYAINTPLRIAAFIAQLGHESGEFTRLEENLNYSHTRLVEVFHKYFPTISIAAPYHRKPESIANKVYGDRLGNGNELSGDGWKYRGRGFMQLTGKANYLAASTALGVDLVSNPSAAASPATAFMVAGWFWDSRDLNKLADIKAFTAITKAINGGTNGLEDRQKYYKKALQVLGG